MMNQTRLDRSGFIRVHTVHFFVAFGGCVEFVVSFSLP